MLNFSIVTPTYQNPEETKAFLESLKLAEKPGKYELIIVDDTADDSIKNIVKDFCKELPIRYFKVKRQFIGEKRNFGAKKAKAEILFFVDSDITFDQKALLVLFESIKNHPEVAMFSGTIIQDDVQLHPTKNDRLITKEDISFVEVIYSAYLVTYRSIFLTLGGYDPIFENRGEGTDLSIKYWRAGYPLARNLKSVVYHPVFKSIRKSPERIAEMYRSLFLVGYKYGLDPEKNKHFIEMQEERELAYGKTTEFYCIYATAKYIDWFKNNYSKIESSKKKALKQTFYDFKPFDIFTQKELLDNCLNQSKKLIAKAFRLAFGEKS